MTNEEMAALQKEAKAVTAESNRLTRALDEARKRRDWEELRALMDQLGPISERQGQLMLKMTDALVDSVRSRHAPRRP